METVGNTLMPITPEAAIVVVLSQALVLFLFSSQALSDWLHSIGLPSIPLVPVSSSQVVIGSIIGIGLLKGGNQIKYKVLGSIGTGWVATPIIAGLISFFLLFFIHNVFRQDVGLNDNIITTSAKASVDTTKQLPDDTVSYPQQGQDLITTIENAESNMESYLWTIIGILLVTTGSTVYYFLRREKKNKELYNQKTDELEKEVALQAESMEKELESYRREHEGLDKELKYRQNEMTTMATNIIKKYELVSQIKEDINKIKKGIKDAESRRAISEVIIKINQNLLYDRDREKFQMYLEDHNSNFMHRLNEMYPDMTDNEKRLAALLRMNLSSKEIASILNISTKSVEMNRYRLRKKLQIPPKQNLTDFIRNF